MPSQKKITIVSSLADKLTQNPNFVVVDFNNVTHLTLESLRKALREQAASMEVVKNSLFKIALLKLKQTGLVERGELLKGKSAVITLPEDWAAALASFYKFAKGAEGLVFKIGIVDGQIYERSGLEKMAMLPSREELIVTILRSLKSPQTKLVYAMNFGMMNFVNVLKQKATQN